MPLNDMAYNALCTLGQIIYYIRIGLLTLLFERYDTQYEETTFIFRGFMQQLRHYGAEQLECTYGLCKRW